VASQFVGYLFLGGIEFPKTIRLRLDSGCN